MRLACWASRCGHGDLNRLRRPFPITGDLFGEEIQTSWRAVSSMQINLPSQAVRHDNDGIAGAGIGVYTDVTNEASTARRSIGRSVAAGMAASVRRKASIVAMLGSIMAAPSAMPASTALPTQQQCTLDGCQ